MNPTRSFLKRKWWTEGRVAPRCLVAGVLGMLAGAACSSGAPDAAAQDPVQPGPAHVDRWLRYQLQRYQQGESVEQELLLLGPSTRPDRVLLQVFTRDTPARFLADFAHRIEVAQSHSRRIVAYASLDEVEAISGHPDVRRVEPVQPDVPMEDVPSHLRMMNVPMYHDNDPAYRGQGIRVAIIDMGFAGLDDRIAEGLVPQPSRQYVCTASGCENGWVGSNEKKVHGTGVAEIVASIAPDAELLLFRVDDGAAKAVATDRAVDEGARVISMSIGSNPVNCPLNGRGFEGDIYDAIASARAAGVLFVVSAGNTGQMGYVGTFDGDAEGWHVFDWMTYDYGQGEVPLLAFRDLLVHLQEGQTVTFGLTWDEWDLQTPESSSARSDFDIYVYDEDDRRICVGICQDNAVGDFPIDGFQWTAADTGTYRIRFRRTVASSDGRNPQLRFNLWPDGSANLPLQGGTPAMTLTSPADTRDGLSVGAVSAGTLVLQPYSSRGPTTDARIKPDLVSFDGVTTASYGPNGFPGTSAAAPHVAGIAALYLSRSPGMTVDELETLLLSNAFDIGSAGPDSDTGHGRARLPPIVAPRVRILSPTASQPLVLNAGESGPGLARLSVAVESDDGLFLGGSSADDFRVRIGGVEATVVQVIEESDAYAIVIRAPLLEPPGPYDLSVELAATWIDSSTVEDAVQYRLPDQPGQPELTDNRLDVVLVLDRSGSMSGDPLLRAKEAALLFVDLLHAGDRVGVVSFSDTARQEIPLTLVTEDKPPEDLLDVVPGESLPDWVLDAPWTAVPVEAPDSTLALHESPDGNYTNGMSAIAAYNNLIDVSGTSAVTISLTTNYETEACCDHGRVEVSFDGGASWQIAHDLAGSSGGWKELSKVVQTGGAPAMSLRLRFTSDGSSVADGWYVSRIRVQTAPVAWRQSVANAIQAIQDSGSTSIGGGLSAAHKVLASSAVGSRSRVVVLLSDGQENVAPMVKDVLPSLDASGATVYAVGLGDVDQVLMQTIADTTGGLYAYAPTPEFLTGIYSRFAVVVAGQQDIENQEDQIPVGQTRTYPFNVDSSISEITVTVNWLASGVHLVVEIQDPDGVVHACDAPGPGLTCTQGSSFAAWRLNDPAPGQWVVRVTSPATTSRALMQSLPGMAPVPLASEGDEVAFEVQVGGATDVLFEPYLNARSLPEGAPNLVRAALLSDRSFLSRRAVADVTSPDGTVHRIDLHDDGLHGDDLAGDGVFAVPYPRTVPIGKHQLRIECFGTLEDGSTFRRVATAQFDVVAGEDTDADGLPDAWEREMFFSLSQADASTDSDGDGLAAIAEMAAGSHPLYADTDDDWLDDSREVGLGTSPQARDSDLGGVPDGIEVAMDSNPLDASDDHPEPHLTLSNDEVHFQILEPGASVRRPLVVRNDGDTRLDVLQARFSGPDASSFGISPSVPWLLAPGESREATITLTPFPERSVYQAELLLESNDPRSPERRVLLVAGELALSCQDVCAACECGAHAVCGCECGECEAGSLCNEELRCVPDCDARCIEGICGLIAGCDCGECGFGLLCGTGNTCEIDCSARCADSRCGEIEGCDCGECAAGYSCDEDHSCVADCAVRCEGRACGTFDGCNCGQCSEGLHCSLDGTCVADCLDACPVGTCGFVGGCDCGGCPEGERCGDDQHCVSICGALCVEGACGLQLGCDCGGCGEGQECGPERRCVQVPEVPDIGEGNSGCTVGGPAGRDHQGGLILLVVSALLVMLVRRRSGDSFRGMSD